MRARFQHNTYGRPAATVPWGVDQANQASDNVSSGLDPIGRLDPPPPEGGYVNFTYNVRVPEEYLNQAGVWVSWLPGETHPREYRGADAATRVLLNATNNSSGGWQGPWR